MGHDHLRIVGVIELHSDDYLLRYGYDINEFPLEDVMIWWSNKNGSIKEENLYFIKEEKTYYLPDYYVRKSYNIEEGKEKYPELFL